MACSEEMAEVGLGVGDLTVTVVDFPFSARQRSGIYVDVDLSRSYKLEILRAARHTVNIDGPVNGSVKVESVGGLDLYEHALTDGTVGGRASDVADDGRHFIWFVGALVRRRGH